MLIEEQNFDIYKIKEILEDLTLVLNSNIKDIVIDLSKVEQIDLSAIQLLLSMKKTCELKGKSFKITNANNNIIESFELSGSKGILL